MRIVLRLDGRYRLGNLLRYSFRFFICLFLLSYAPGISGKLCAENITRPAVLFVSPRGLMGGWVDLDYLNELHRQRFEVDFTERQGDFNWDRIKKYNSLVLFSCPSAKGEDSLLHQAKEPPYRPDFIALVERYLSEGGGVFLMAKSAGGDYAFYDLIKTWGARIPYERYREQDPAKTALYPNMRGYEKCFFTDRISASPITMGVRQLWLPYMDHYAAADCMPLDLSEKWKVAVRGSKTSHTEPVDLSTDHDSRLANKNFKPLIRPGGKKEPALIGMRDYGNGRLVLCSMHPIHTVGQGTKWLYERRCLEKGFDQRPSDFSLLFRNSLRWLSEPSVRSGKIGGYQTEPLRLIPRVTRPGAKKKVEDLFWSRKELDYHRSPLDGKIFKGLIGAKSMYGGGKGSISVWAEAGRKAGLSFICFMDDFDELTPEKLAILDAECKKNSDDKIVLFPGYTIANNIGNRLFVFGYGTPWPPEQGLTGPKKTLLNQQYEEDGVYKNNSVVVDWIISSARGAGGPGGFWRQVGFYDFRDPRCMKMYDLRLCSAAAVRYYENHQLVEDTTADYLKSTPGTLGFSPVSVNIVRSPEELIAEVKSRNALTYVKADEISGIMEHGLRWQAQYDGKNIFCSDGPLIHRFPDLYRVMVYGGESFVSNRNNMPVPVHVSSTIGLKEIRIYNGEKIIRRVLCNGCKEYRNTFRLAANIQRTMILEAVDLQGGKAISYTRASRAYSAPKVAFCGDHCNDCGNQYLSRGIAIFKMHRCPLIDAGFSWDGGPFGKRRTVFFDTMEPILDSNLGKEGHRRFSNIPILETADNSAIAVRSVRNRIFDKAIPIVHAWLTYGPLDPTQLYDGTARYVEYARPSVGVRPVGHGITGMQKGAVLSEYFYEMTFKKELTIRSLTFQTSVFRGPWPLMFVSGSGEGRCTVADVSIGRRALKQRVNTGDWIGFYCPDTPSNGILLVNRGVPFDLDINPGRDVTPITLDAVADGIQTKRGTTMTYGLLSIIDPIDRAGQGPARFLRLIEYLKNPEKIEILHGERVATEPYFTEITASDYAEVRIQKPKREIGITLPVRVVGLCENWSAGYWQKKGHNTGYYDDGTDRYRPAGFDFDGRVYASLYPDMAPEHHVIVGHPVVCDNRDLVIEAIPDAPYGDLNLYWYVAVNNRSDKPVKATFKQGMDVPGLNFNPTTVTIPCGGYIVLQDDTKPEWMAQGRRLD